MATQSLSVRALWITSLAVMVMFVSPSSERARAQNDENTPAQPDNETPPAEADDDGSGGPSRNATRSLPRLAEMKLPSAEELLRGEKLDWIVLSDEEEHVLVTEPVFPRPDTITKMQKALDDKLKERKNLTGEALERFREELDDLAHIEVQMPAQYNETQYRLHMDKVSRIIHHEDQILMRIDRLIQQENFRTRL